MTERAAWIDEGVEPRYDGVGGKVWAFAPPPADDDDPRRACTIGDLHLLYAPAAHPLWAWHVLMAVALRDVPGVPPAIKRYPEAEYEVMVLALHPDHPPPDPRKWPMGTGNLNAMEPADAVVQFHDTGDDGAAELVELCASAVANGVLIPDSDHAESWRRSIKLTADHIRFGGHPEAA